MRYCDRGGIRPYEKLLNFVFVQTNAEADQLESLNRLFLEISSYLSDELAAEEFSKLYQTGFTAMHILSTLSSAICMLQLQLSFPA